MNLEPKPRPLNRRLFLASGLAALAVPLAVPLTGCTTLQNLTGLSLAPASTAAGDASSNESGSGSRNKNKNNDLGNANADNDVVFDSQFTKNGVSNIYKNIDGIDYVLSIFPSQTNPRSDLWYPKGDKQFTFTFQTYDLAQPLDAPYATKRMTYLRGVSISSVLTLADTEEGDNAEQTMSSDFNISGLGQDLTFDPEPWVEGDLGMRIASPKGVFEMHRQTIGDLPADAIGITLHFKFNVNAQRTAGEPEFDSQQIDIDVPIGITKSNKETPTRTVPVDAA